MEKQKQFMILMFADGKGMDQFSEEEMKVEMGKWFAWDAELTEKGQKVHGEALSRDAKTIRNSRDNVEDGLFNSDPNMMVGGYYVVNADSMEDAVEIAKGCPSFDVGGSVEVREIMFMYPDEQEA